LNETSTGRTLEEAKAGATMSAASESGGGGTPSLRSQERREAERKGNIDITLYRGTGFHHPFAIIENKGVLTFTQAGELYAGSASEVNKDLERNADFVKAHGD
jgi:hypothetical protein